MFGVGRDVCGSSSPTPLPKVAVVHLEVPLCYTWAAFVFRVFWVVKNSTIFKWRAPADYLSVINPEDNQVGGVGSIRMSERCYGELNTGTSAETLPGRFHNSIC